MKKIGYYHVYLTENESTWLSMLSEQYKVMEDAGLFDALDEFHLVCVGKDIEQFDKALYFTGLYYPHTVQYRFDSTVEDSNLIDTIKTESTSLITENITMRLIYDKVKSSDEEAYILYLHTKGITSTLRHFQNSYEEINLYRTYQYWRHYLNYGVLEKWEECVRALTFGHDVAGINYQTWPHPHYSGNFWWAKSSHIASLPDPGTYDWWEEVKANALDPWLKQADNRYADEQWPCSKKDGRYYNVEKGIPNPANVYTPRKVYATCE